MSLSEHTGVLAPTVGRSPLSSEERPMRMQVIWSGDARTESADTMERTR